jgi:hypothetical protein
MNIIHMDLRGIGGFGPGRAKKAVFRGGRTAKNPRKKAGESERLEGFPEKRPEDQAD